MRPLHLISTVTLLILTARSCASAQSPDARQRIDQLATTSSLQQPGNKPWHLSMTFDLHDLDGKVKESGTIEEWWVSPQKYRLVIASPSFNETVPDKSEAPSGHANRAAFLINALLEQVTNPVPSFPEKDTLTVTNITRDFGKIKLPCLAVGRRTPEANGKSLEMNGPTFCIEPGTDILRSVLDLDQGKVIVRNRLGHFRSTYVAMDNVISYNGKIAIEGKVIKLEGYDPATNPVEVRTVDSTPAKIPGIVLAGKNTRKPTPIYPELAKQERLSGTVLLNCIISREGTISSIEVVSSAAPMLDRAAIDAVKHWQYQPYLLDGSPTEVDTTITVHFNLN